jgi:hypothetical protein
VYNGVVKISVSFNFASWLANYVSTPS